MLNPRIHHRHGANKFTDSSELGAQVTRNRSPSLSRSPSRRGRRSYPSDSSDTQSRSPSASRYRPRNTDPGSGLDANIGEADDSQSKLSTYDTLIAFAFALCVILFFRALMGGGTSAPEPTLPQNPSDTKASWWQRHHAFASSREHLHAKAGIHTRENCHDGQEHPEDGKASGVWHRGGVHADPHAHLSVDLEGHFSYGFHHDHDHEHHQEQNHYDQYETANAGPSRSSPLTLTWGIPHFFRRSEPTKESNTIETPSSGPEGSVSDVVEKEEISSGQLRDREAVDDDPFASPNSDDVELHDYAVRVHLPSEGGVESGTRSTLHRKERGRAKARGNFHT